MDSPSMSAFLTSSQEADLNALMASEGLHNEVLLDDDYTVSSTEQDADVKPFGNSLGLACTEQPQRLSPFYGGGWSVPATMKLPSTERYEGESHFGLNLHGPNEGKSWIFSIPLNKVFINVGNKFPVQFMWNPASVNEPRVRAVLMFLSADSVEESVERCNHHALRTDKSNLNFPHDFRHIVRAHHSSAEYWTDPTSERRSVVVPLEPPQAGTCGTTILYSFGCKNSCPSGMNRRATQLIFTLEDVDGQIHGREAMLIRICSCPKRDKDKEEADIVKTSVSKDKRKSVKRQMVSDHNTDLKRARQDAADLGLFPEQDPEIIEGHALTSCVILTARAKRRGLTAFEERKLAWYSSQL